jgi:opacity protein-like surface antigen
MLADVGVALTLDTDVKDIAATPASTGLSGAKISLDPGVRFDVGLGYEIYDWLAIEVETGLIWNGVNNISGTVTDFNPPLVGTNLTLTGGSGGIYTVPIMFNLQARIPMGQDPLQPLWLVVGGGVGTVWSDADVNNVGSVELGDLLTTSVRGSGWAFAFQASAGFEWSLARNISLGVRYAFLGTTQLNYGRPTFNIPGIVGTADIKVDAIYTNAIMATLKLEF